MKRVFDSLGELCDIVAALTWCVKHNGWISFWGEWGEWEISLGRKNTPNGGFLSATSESVSDALVDIKRQLSVAEYAKQAHDRNESEIAAMEADPAFAPTVEVVDEDADWLYFRAKKVSA